MCEYHLQAWSCIWPLASTHWSTHHDGTACSLRWINSIGTHKMYTVNKHMVVKFMLYGQFYDNRYLVNNVHYICCYCVTGIEFYQHTSLDSRWRAADWQPLLCWAHFHQLAIFHLEQLIPYATKWPTIYAPIGFSFRRRINLQFFRTHFAQNSPSANKACSAILVGVVNFYILATIDLVWFVTSCKLTQSKIQYSINVFRCVLRDLIKIIGLCMGTSWNGAHD